MSFQISTFVHAGLTGTSGTNTVTSPSFVGVTGNLLIVAVSIYNPNVSATVAITDNIAGSPNSYTFIGSSPLTPGVLDGEPNIWFFYCNNFTGSSTMTVTVTNTGAIHTAYVQLAVWQISGAQSGNPIDTFKIGGASSGSNAQTTSSLTTQFANEILLAYGSLSNTGATYSAGSGGWSTTTYGLTNSDDGGLSGCEWLQVASVQTGFVPAISATDSTHKWQMAAVAIIGASQPGGGGQGNSPLGFVIFDLDSEGFPIAELQTGTDS